MILNSEPTPANSDFISEPVSPIFYNRLFKLTMREWSVLLLIADGLTTSEIAEHLFVEPKSIANYKGRIRTKLKLTGHNSLFVFGFSNKEHLNKIHKMLQP